MKTLPAYRMLLISSTKDPKQLKTALAGSTYQTGFWVYTKTLSLVPGGKAIWKGEKEDPDWKGGSDIPTPVSFEETGTWSLEGNRLRMKNLGERSGLYEVSPEGLRRLQPAPPSNDMDFPAIPKVECDH